MTSHALFFTIAAIGSLLIIVGFLFFRDKNNIAASQSANSSLPIIQIGEVDIEVELADSWREKARGLSGRQELPENQGMLFVYETPGLHSFWMLDMKFSIDIIWIDESHRIIDITENISPDSFPRTFKPKAPAQYVLEVNAAWTERKQINIGAVVSMDSVISSSPIQLDKN